MRSNDSPHLRASELEAARSLEPSFLRAFEAAYDYEHSIMPAQALADTLELGAIRHPGGSLTQHFAAGAGISDLSDVTPMGTVLPPEEANEKYGMDDREQKILNFTKPVSDEEASLLRDKKIKELATTDVLDRVKGFGDNLALLPAVLLAELRDPLGFTSIFVPGAASRKFLTGFLSGGTASALVLTPAAIRDTEFQGTFQSQQLVLSILAGGTLSGAVSKGLGTLDKLKQVYKKREDTYFREKSDETPVQVDEPPVSIDDSQAMQTRVDAVIADEENFSIDAFEVMQEELNSGRSAQEAIAFTRQVQKASSEKAIVELENTHMEQLDKLNKMKEELDNTNCREN